MAFCWRVNGPPLNAGLVAMWFLADPDQYCWETLYFCDFSGGGVRTPWPPSGSAHGMHLKEGTCLKCSLIIGLKVGLDYNSWYACLPVIRHSDNLRLQTLIAGRKSRERERERERERSCTVFAVNQSSDEDPKPKLIVGIGFCTAKSDIPKY